MANTSVYPIIQASEDGRVNESVYLQLEHLKNSMEREGKTFDENKPFYLERVGANAPATAEGEIRNSLNELGIKGHNQEKMLHIIGHDTMKYKVRPSDENRLGGFTYAQTKKFHDKIFNSPQEFKNSMIDGLPFTFGANMTNIRVQMPEMSSYDFLSNLELGSPTGTTLFGSSEVLTMLEFGGEPSNITNGSTSVGTASYSGTQAVAPYKVVGMNLAQLNTMVDNHSAGFAGDTLIQQVYGRGLDVAKMKIKTQLMRDFYSTLESAKDTAGNFLVPTYQLQDIDNTITQNVSQLFSKSSGIGDFLTKIIPAIVAPANKFLETQQASLSRIVLHTSFEAVWRNSVATYGLTGGTTGQTYAGINIQEVLKNIQVFFGGDICHTSNPAPEDIRVLCMADPTNPDYKSSEFGAIWMVVALAPTIVTSYAGLGFSDQILLTRYTQPNVSIAKRAMFIQG